jgi:hypothetical protein
MKSNTLLSLVLSGLTAFAAAGCGAVPGAEADVETVSSALTFTDATLENGWTGGGWSTAVPGWTYASGIVYLRGSMFGGTAQKAFTLPVGRRPSARLYVPVNLYGAKKGRLMINTDGSVSVAAEVNLTDAYSFTSLDGVSFPASDASSTALTLKNGWTNAAWSTRKPSAIVIGDVVHLAGALTSAGPSLNAFKLPVGMAPSTDVYLPIDLYAGHKGTLLVQPTGEAYILAEQDISHAYSFTSLESVSYPLTPAAAGYTCLTPTGTWIGKPYNTRMPCLKNDNGVIRMMGAIKGGTGSPFTLPAGLRPGKRVYVEADVGSSQQGRIMIEPTGVVTMHPVGSTAPESFTSFEGVIFTP